MADKTKIEWTDATWNPITGCTRVDEGCRNCYSEIMAARFSDPGQWGHGLAQRVKVGGATDHRWTGKTQFVEHKLADPLHWRKPRRIFVCSTSDLFHEKNPDAWIDRVFALMALCPQHTFQVLTKRPERAREYLDTRSLPDEKGFPAEDIRIQVTSFTQTPSRRAKYPSAAKMVPLGKFCQQIVWPLPHVWLGISVSDQASADLRIPHLLATPAAVRFISAEPLLGPVDLTDLQRPAGAGTHHYSALDCDVDVADDTDFHGATINWVICGGESGPGARPMHPDWARSLRDQCEAAGVAFFFKQWGEWVPISFDDLTSEHLESEEIAGRVAGFFNQPMHRVGKFRARRTLDGRTWDQMPGVVK